jgi:hypothetical protein
VSGFGMSNPGKLLELMAAHGRDELPDNQLAGLQSARALGFWATVVCQAAHESLSHANSPAEGVIDGPPVEIAELLRRSGVNPIGD